MRTTGWAPQCFNSTDRLPLEWRWCHGWPRWRPPRPAKPSSNGPGRCSSCGKCSPKSGRGRFWHQSWGHHTTWQSGQGWWADEGTEERAAHPPAAEYDLNFGPRALQMLPSLLRMCPPGDRLPTDITVASAEARFKKVAKWSFPVGFQGIFGRFAKFMTAKISNQPKFSKTYSLQRVVF